MKNNYMYGLLALLLCLSFKAQAQGAVELDRKLSTLSALEAKELVRLVYENPSTFFVDDAGEATVYDVDQQGVELLSVKDATEALKIKNAFGNRLNQVVMLSIDWDGNENIVLPSGMLQQMDRLKYVYIISSQPTNANRIQLKLTNLLQALHEKEGIEVLYSRMNNPK